jgi:hypothetical protein
MRMSGFNTNVANGTNYFLGLHSCDSSIRAIYSSNELPYNTIIPSVSQHHVDKYSFLVYDDLQTV